MRYSETEQTVLVGQFKPNQTVRIKIIELATDNLVDVDTDVCIESKHMSGMYLWKTSNIKPNAVSGYSNLLYEMKTVEDGKVFYGKFVFGGYPDDSVDVNLDEVVELATEINDTVDIINARI